jgi:hypothetical protein
MGDDGPIELKKEDNKSKFGIATKLAIAVLIFGILYAIVYVSKARGYNIGYAEGYAAIKKEAIKPDVRQYTSENDKEISGVEYSLLQYKLDRYPEFKCILVNNENPGIITKKMYRQYEDAIRDKEADVLRQKLERIKTDCP